MVLATEQVWDLDLMGILAWAIWDLWRIRDSRQRRSWENHREKGSLPVPSNQGGTLWKRMSWFLFPSSTHRPLLFITGFSSLRFGRRGCRRASWDIFTGFVMNFISHSYDLNTQTCIVLPTFLHMINS